MIITCSRNGASILFARFTPVLILANLLVLFAIQIAGFRHRKSTHCSTHTQTTSAVCCCRRRLHKIHQRAQTNVRKRISGVYNTTSHTVVLNLENCHWTNYSLSVSFLVGALAPTRQLESSKR